MADTELDLFAPRGSEYKPLFYMARKGYDPEQVDAHLAQLNARIATLEEELHAAWTQRDAAQRRYSTAKEDAYRELASRMADLLRSADQEAEQIRRSADEEAGWRVAEARDQADQLLGQAREEAERLRRQGEEALGQTRAEVERVLGGLSASRDSMVHELRMVRNRLAGVVEQIDAAVEASRVPEPDPDLVATDGGWEDELPEAPTSDTGAAEVGTDTQEFHVVIPDLDDVERPEPPPRG